MFWTRGAFHRVIYPVEVCFEPFLAQNADSEHRNGLMQVSNKDGAQLGMQTQKVSQNTRFVSAHSGVQNARVQDRSACYQVTIELIHMYIISST